MLSHTKFVRHELIISELTISDIDNAVSYKVCET